MTFCCLREKLPPKHSQTAARGKHTLASGCCPLKMNASYSKARWGCALDKGEGCLGVSLNEMQMVGKPGTQPQGALAPSPPARLLPKGHRVLFKDMAVGARHIALSIDAPSKCLYTCHLSD